MVGRQLYAIHLDMKSHTGTFMTIGFLLENRKIMIGIRNMERSEETQGRVTKSAKTKYHLEDKKIGKRYLYSQRYKNRDKTKKNDVRKEKAKTRKSRNYRAGD